MSGASDAVDEREADASSREQGPRRAGPGSVLTGDSRGGLRHRIGFEVELLAPAGRTRADVAEVIAAAVGGEVVRAFHRDSEPSAVPGMGTFRHLTPRFDVVEAGRSSLCSVVDDVTLVDDLDARAPALPGWYRVLTDDPRLLALLDRTCDPAAPLEEVLKPVAAMFGTDVVRAGQVHKVCDADGRSVAMAAPLAGDRHRPAEIVTPPLERDHGTALERLLGPARDLGFTVPVEAAVHLHFDAAPYRHPTVLANLVALFSGWREPIRALLGTNRACRRLGPLSPDLVDSVGTLHRLGSWTEAVDALRGVPMSKFCDVNLLGLVGAPAAKDTLEVRILPGAIRTSEIVRRAQVVEGLLDRCRTGPVLPRPSGRPRDDARTVREWGRLGR